MTDLLSHLSDEPRNNGYISLCRKANCHMAVDTYRYHFAAVGWKEAGILEDHILERNLLTLGTGTSG